ncbi:gamma subclass chorismate mutase AroQ [Streptomyces sp. RKAG290]|uniref:gamma subclass chorismate mutase AroQ n=1 Tax=Streptomyces sp. RKAG290 TaxID=2888348 RepID=UPI0020334F85|nr:gamma subclass chorismate mutase AroQ [Streptomyces sp. RKAG290]MCM2415949.1 gamma subclass chorismate mutase AroQ [Streptomyces sp. RKAG290]
MATAAFIAGPGTRAAATPSPAAPAAGASLGGYARLHSLAALSARRLDTARPVAAAKWGTGDPVEDPSRERQVLDTAALQAREAGADPGATVRIFRDQIEANKQVQRALHRRWDADPSVAPKLRPDLTEVREAINRVNVDLVRAIADSAAARAAPSCAGTLSAAESHVRRIGHLDRPRTAALTRALRSVCTAGAPRPGGPHSWSSGLSAWAAPLTMFIVQQQQVGVGAL